MVANLTVELLVLSVAVLVPSVLVKLSVFDGQSALSGPSVYLTVMSSSNTPESGAVSRIGPNCLVPVSEPPVTTVDVAVITPSCAVVPPAVARTTASEPLET